MQEHAARLCRAHPRTGGWPSEPEDGGPRRCFLACRATARIPSFREASLRAGAPDLMASGYCRRGGRSRSCYPMLLRSMIRQFRSSKRVGVHFGLTRRLIDLARPTKAAASARSAMPQCARRSMTQLSVKRQEVECLPPSQDGTQVRQSDVGSNCASAH